MKLDHFVLVDASSGTSFDASKGLLLDTRQLTGEELEVRNEGSFDELCQLAVAKGVDLEKIITPEMLDSQQAPQALPPTPQEKLTQLVRKYIDARKKVHEANMELMPIEDELLAATGLCDENDDQIAVPDGDHYFLLRYLDSRYRGGQVFVTNTRDMLYSPDSEASD